MIKTIKTILSVFLLISLQEGMASREKILQSPEGESIESLTNFVSEGNPYSLGKLFSAWEEYVAYLQKKLKEIKPPASKYKEIENDIKELKTFIDLKKQLNGKMGTGAIQEIIVNESSLNSEEKAKLAQQILELGQTIEEQLLHTVGDTVKPAKRK